MAKESSGKSATPFRGRINSPARPLSGKPTSHAAARLAGQSRVSPNARPLSDQPRHLQQSHHISTIRPGDARSTASPGVRRGPAPADKPGNQHAPATAHDPRAASAPPMQPQKHPKSAILTPPTDHRVAAPPNDLSISAVRGSFESTNCDSLHKVTGVYDLPHDESFIDHQSVNDNQSLTSLPVSLENKTSQRGKRLNVDESKLKVKFPAVKESSPPPSDHSLNSAPSSDAVHAGNRRRSQLSPGTGGERRKSSVDVLKERRKSSVIAQPGQAREQSSYINIVGLRNRNPTDGRDRELRRTSVKRQLSGTPEPPKAPPPPPPPPPPPAPAPAPVQQQHDVPVFKFYTSRFGGDNLTGRVTGIEVGFGPHPLSNGDTSCSAVGYESTPTSWDILAVGGVKDQYNKDGICFAQRYSMVGKCWEKFSDMPEPRLNFAVGYLKKCLYVMGGYDPREAKDGVLATKDTFQFDTSTSSWNKTGEMKTARSFLAVCCLENRLYALGGQDENDRVLNTVEVFDPSASRWSSIAPMSVARVGASCVAIQGQIMITGGYGAPAKEGSPCPVLLSTEWFDPITCRWDSKAELPAARAQACMVVVDDCVYLCGGVKRDPFTGVLCSMRDVSMFDIVTKAWTNCTDLQTARHNAGAAVIDGKIYIVGGVSTDTNQVLRSVECYDTVSRNWDKSLPELPRGAKSIACVAIPGGRD